MLKIVGKSEEIERSEPLYYEGRSGIRKKIK